MLNGFKNGFFWNKLPLLKYGFTYCSNLFFVMVWKWGSKKKIGLFIWCMGANAQIHHFLKDNK
jgi:hypothetical protein